MAILRLGVVAALFTLAAPAQPSGPVPAPPTPAAAAPPLKRSWNTIRKGEAFVPMTAEERWQFLLRRTFTRPGVPARAMFQAALDQKGNYPEHWGQGWDAYGQRVAFHMARSATRNVIESATAAALRYDQRYIRCSHSGVLRRTFHALAMNFVTYDQHGHWVPNAPRIGSTVAVEYIALKFLPDGTRTARETTRGLGFHVASGSLVNIWREFSPDILKKLKRK